MSVAKPQPADRKPKLRWFQFSLRTLLVVVTLCAIPCSWLALKLREASRQRRAVKAIERCGGSVTINTQRPGTLWLLRLLGEDLYSDVVGASFCSPSKDTNVPNDFGYYTIGGLHYGPGGNLPKEEYCDLTDAELREYVGVLPKLEILDLSDNEVSDAGLERLKDLPQLKQLILTRTRVTDAGLRYLEGLTRLQTLDLYGTKVTDAGVKKLQQALPNCKIER